MHRHRPVRLLQRTSPFERPPACLRQLGQRLARRIGMTIRSRAPAKASPPATNSPTATHFRSGTVAPASAVTTTPAWPFAFITTVSHVPLLGFHASVCVPVPEVRAVQTSVAPGGVRGAVTPPAAGLILNGDQSVTTAWRTPAR